MIKLTAISVCGNSLKYEYTNDPRLDRFFNKDIPFFVEFQDVSVDFADVPNSILSVPFVANLLPLAWLFNITIEVDELDESFYQSIEQIKWGFKRIYPEVIFSGAVSANKIINNSYINSNNTVCLFSGGVDAMYTLLKHRQERPTLINVWGVDISFDDLQGHAEVERHNKKVAESFQCRYICVKSSLRSFLNEQFLNQESYRILEDYWWHGAQHSIGLLSILAPYNYIMKTRTNYIASSFTEKELQMGVKCVSFPVIDEAYRVADTRVCHDGFEANRSMKIKYICDVYKYDNLSLELKVCFQFKNGKNCSCCEKCYRTMMDILVFDNQLGKYGFSSISSNASEIRAFLDTSEVKLYNWLPIQESYRNHPENDKPKWFVDYKINSLKSMRSKIRRLGIRIRKWVK